MKQLNLKFLYLVLFFVIGIVGCGEDKEGKSGPAAAPAITSLDEITGTADRRELVGRSVSIEDGTVQAVVGNFIFWGGDNHNQIPVVRLDKMAGPVSQHVRAGDKVRIFGTVRLAESVPDSDRMWETVTEAEKADIKNATVYVAADRVQVK